MATQIFLNLAVRDLDRSVAFFTALGYRFEPKFTDENATCMVVADNIFVMLLVERYFATFVDKPLCDARQSVEAITALTLDSRERVDDMMAKALAGGAREPRAAMDLGFMYNRSYEDLDGHLWEVAWNPYFTLREDGSLGLPT